jgi:hypothetical protein
LRERERERKRKRDALFEETHEDVGVEAALVSLVEHNHRVA